jgi:hypothetical protein
MRSRAPTSRALEGCLIIWLPRAGRTLQPQHEEDGPLAARAFRGRLWIGVELLTGGFDARRLELLETLGKHWICRGSPRATCTCIGAAAAPAGCVDRDSLEHAAARRGLCLVSERRALFAALAASARTLSRAACSRNARSPSAAPSISMSCAMNIPRRSCPRAKRHQPSACA